MPTTCSVKFDNTTGLYYAGQDVSGMARLTTTSEKTIRGVEIKLVGYARTLFWDNRRKPFAGEKLVKSGGYVIGSEDGTTFTYHAGTYNYSFRCNIPTKAPSSFEGQYGFVRYVLKIKINRYSKFDNVFKEPFVVILPLDLNFNPRLRMSDSVYESNDYTSKCCRTGSISAYLNTPIIGYVPGQTVPYKILIDNETNSDLNKIFVGISQICFYATQFRRQLKRITEYKVIKKSIDPITRYSRKEIYDNLVMPPVPPSTIDTTTILAIWYCLYLKIYTGCCKTTFKLTIPLTVGVIPIVNTYEMPIRPPVFKEAIKSKDESMPYDPYYSRVFGYQVKEYDIQYPVYDGLTTKNQYNW